MSAPFTSIDSETSHASERGATRACGTETKRAPLGATPIPGGTRFATFTTTARACAVLIFDEGGRIVREVPMAAVGDGHFTADVRGAGPGTRYKLRLDDRELPDPYARWLPEGVHGPAVVLAEPAPLGHAHVFRPLAEHVIYELHVGTFTDEGTFAAARGRLPALASLGITAVEIMPIAAFAGARGWGYDGVALYAPHAAYGTPDDVRAFVDEAHRLGLAVFLDVVYNHFGPSGNYLSAYSPTYFTTRLKTAWGDAPDFTNPVLRRLVIDSAVEWLTRYGFDGLRLDAIHAIVDPSPCHVITEIAARVAAIDPRLLVIGEDERNDPALVTEMGLHAVWADDFHHQLRVTATGERDGYYAAYRPGAVDLARAIERGWLYEGQHYEPLGKARGQIADALPAAAFVYCLQNHDQIGNRAFGDRLNHVVPPPLYRAASTLLLFLPMTPLLFMGQEWAASSPFQYFTDHDEALGRMISVGRREEFKRFDAFADAKARQRIPDPQSSDTFARSKLRWSEREEGEHAQVLALYERMLGLRRHDPVLRQNDRRRLRAAAVAHAANALVVERWTDEERRVLIVNLSEGPLDLAPLDTSGLTLILRSDGGTTLEPTLPAHTAALCGGRGPGGDLTAAAQGGVAAASNRS